MFTDFWKFFSLSYWLVNLQQIVFKYPTKPEICRYITLWNMNVRKLAGGNLKYVSNAHTVVWECCKDDQQSQWETLKFDPQLPLKPLSDHYNIWHTWLRHGYLSPRKNWAQSVKGFLLPIYAKYTPPMFATLCYPIHVRIFTTFLVLPIAYSRDACMDFNA